MLIFEDGKIKSNAYNIDNYNNIIDLDRYKYDLGYKYDISFYPNEVLTCNGGILFLI